MRDVYVSGRKFPLGTPSPLFGASWTLSTLPHTLLRHCPPSSEEKNVRPGKTPRVKYVAGS